MTEWLVIAAVVVALIAAALIGLALVLLARRWHGEDDDE